MALVKTCKKPPMSIISASGSICTFNALQEGLPLKSHTVNLVASQSGSGTPSPSNPRAISGWDAININHSDADTSNPTVYTIQIGSTVYFGEYDARTGVLTVTTWGVDMGSLSWGKSTVGDYSVFYATPEPYKNYNTENMLCSIYSVVDKIRTQLLDGEMGLYNTNNETNWRRIAVRDDSRSNLTGNEFTTAVSGQIVTYKLENPQLIQLSTCNLLTSLGENNIWSDTGNTSLEAIKIGR